MGCARRRMERRDPVAVRVVIAAHADRAAASRRVVMEPGRYFALYAVALAKGARPRRALPTLPILDDRHVHPPPSNAEKPDLPLPLLYSAGVECGHRESRLELKR